MATIGPFRTAGDGFTGEIVTLSVQARRVRIVPVERRPSNSAPSHRVFGGQAEIGAAWTKLIREDRERLAVKLDDPSFAAPIFANLVGGQDGETHRPIRSRQPSRGEDRGPRGARPGALRAPKPPLSPPSRPHPSQEWTVAEGLPGIVPGPLPGRGKGGSRLLATHPAATSGKPSFSGRYAG